MTSDKKSPSCSLAVTLSFQASETQPTQRETERKKKERKNGQWDHWYPHKELMYKPQHTHTHIYIYTPFEPRKSTVLGKESEEGKRKMKTKKSGWLGS